MNRRLSSRVCCCAPALLFTSILAAACGEGPTAPALAGPFEAEEVAAAVDSVVSQFDSSSGTLASLELAGEALATAGAGVAASLLPADGAGGTLLPATTAARRIRTANTGLPLFPSNLLGATLVYDPELAQYVVDGARQGAPANGVRFLYYAIDPITHRPANPLNELGYLDLTDESDAVAMRLGVELVRTAGGGATMLADYVIAASFGQTATTVTVGLDAEGNLSDGVKTLVLDLHEVVSFSETSEAFDVLLDYRLTLPADEVSLRFQAEATVLNSDGEQVAMAATMTITDGPAEAVLNVTTDGTTISGTLKHNGQTVVVVSGDPEGPDFATPDGSPLGATETAALEAIWAAVGHLLAFAASIFSPFSPAA